MSLRARGPLPMPLAAKHRETAPQKSVLRCPCMPGIMSSLDCVGMCPARTRSCELLAFKAGIWPELKFLFVQSQAPACSTCALHAVLRTDALYDIRMPTMDPTGVVHMQTL